MVTGNSHYRYYLLLLTISFHLIGIFATVSRIGKDKIYLDINSEYFCYRRLNSTHQVGCQSGDNGNVGVLDWVRDENDLKYVEAEGKHLPYIPVLQLQDLTTKIIDRLVISKRVSGVIVVHSNETLPPEGFSPESSCPNDPLSLYNSPDINATQYQHCSAQKWTADNPALNLLYRNYEFPILLVTDETDRNNIFECIEKFGRSEKNPTPSWPLCSAQIFTRMKAAKDARTCMRRNTMFNPLDVPTKYCDPLHSFNIFSPLFDFKPNETLESQSVVILSSRMDSLSFFYDKTPGADSPVTSLVVLLSVIETLANLKPFLEQNRGNKSYNVLFALFNGEVFDYIGSGRMAYDMRTGSFSPFDKSSHKIDIPLLDFKSLNSFIELNQLAAYPGKKDIWIHTDPISCRDPAVNETVDELINILLRTPEEPISIKSAPSDLPLPPASFQSFLRENLSLPGVVLTNHLKSFENKFYHSFLDNYVNIGFSANTSDSIDPVTEHLSAISSRVSQSLVQIMTGEYNSSIKANSTTVQNLLHCFLINITCPLFRSYFREQDLKPLKDIDTLPMYIATYGLGRVIPSWWLREVLTITMGLSLGQKTENVSIEECSKLQSSTNRSTFDWIPSANSTNGTCIKSQVFLGEALSPVFLDPDNPRWDLNYSTWTESYWEVPFARIFLKPGNVQESVTMLTGLFITISSIIIMKLFYRFNGVVSKVNAGSSGANLINERNVQC